MEWWRRLFNTTLYFELYESQDTELAKTQVPQLTALLGLTPPARVLDVGCGYGRHGVELARVGFEVTGVDISEVQLARARERAQGAEVAVDFPCWTSGTESARFSGSTAGRWSAPASTSLRRR